MRDKNNTLLPIIECDEKTFDWLTRLPINQINMKNLKWKEFYIVHKMMNTTILISVEFKAMTAKIRVSYNPKVTARGFQERPAYQANVNFVLDRICIDNVKGQWTPYSISMTENRIVPILRFLLSSEKYDVLLKEKKDRNKRNFQQVYNLIRTTNIFGEVFEFTDLLSLESDAKLSRRGTVVTVHEDTIKWLEKFCHEIRTMELEIDEETKTKRYKGAMFNSSLEFEAIKNISAIRVFGDTGFLQLQIRNINNVVEMAYYENGSNKCQMLLYVDWKSNFDQVEVIYHEDDNNFQINAQKIVGFFQNVLIYLRTWDWSCAKNVTEGTWRPCEVTAVPFLEW